MNPGETIYSRPHHTTAKQEGGQPKSSPTVYSVTVRSLSPPQCGPEPCLIRYPVIQGTQIELKVLRMPHHDQGDRVHFFRKSIPGSYVLRYAGLDSGGYSIRGHAPPVIRYDNGRGLLSSSLDPQNLEVGSPEARKLEKSSTARRRGAALGSCHHSWASPA